LVQKSLGSSPSRATFFLGKHGEKE